MDLTDDDLKQYDRAQLKLPSEERNEYIAQADRLIAKLRTSLHGDETYKVKRILRAGSLTKGTILQPTPSHPPDADICVYFKGSLAGFDLAAMQEAVIELLLKAYPQKSRDEFTQQPRTLGMTFVESELEVDLVPIVAHPDDDDFGWQPAPEDERGTPLLTSVPGQLAFVAARRDGDPFFRTLVRFGKKWRDEQELAFLSSFAIELLFAHVQDRQGSVRSLVEGLRRFFLFVAQSELRTAISFPENGAVRDLPSGAVVILDPVNAANNVTAKIDESQRRDLVAAAQAAWFALQDARSEQDPNTTVGLWRGVLGRDFNVPVPA